LPSGLRGGGACFFYLASNQNVPGTRRRGRWRSERTLEHYLQEAFAMIALEQIPNHARDRVQSMAALAHTIFQ